MSARGRQQRRKEITCLADLVSKVPSIITNFKNGESYDCLQFLGSGSYGKCFEVSHRNTKERYACKVLSKHLVQDTDLRQLVQSEIRIHRKLKHEHVVALIESFDDEKHVFLVQSLCTNNSLRELQKHRGRLSLSEIRYVIYQILQGTQYIHDQSVIHRDLKLSNILIDHNMQMKICDFGLAIRADDLRLLSACLCGTTNYLAPEVIARHGFRRRSDIWAIGVIAFVLQYGYKPFDENNTMATHQRILRADYTVPSDENGDFKHLLRQIFEKNVEYRATANECLKLDFFLKYQIPHRLPSQTFVRQSITEQKEPTCTLQCNLANFKSMNEFVEKKVEYPDIQLISSPEIQYSFENNKFAERLKQIFIRFDAICRFHEIETDSSITDFSDGSDIRPEYWVTKWSYEKCGDRGFAYQISDGSMGINFHGGFKLMHTPDDKYWSFEPGDEQFRHIINVSHTGSKLEDYLIQFYRFENGLDKNGSGQMAYTTYRRHESTYLYTWEHTDEAMVMLLSNMTLQINFTRSHKKMLICPQNETVTFFHGPNESFKTVTFAAIGTQGFSEQRFVMFKYVTAVMKHMSNKLCNASNALIGSSCLNEGRPSE